MTRKVVSVAGTLAGLTSTAIRTALGTNSCKSASRFASYSLEKIDPCQVSARSRKAGDQTKLDRVFADTKGGTTADMILRGANASPEMGQYEIYDLGNNAILAGYSVGQIGTD